jgi:hypothetical protein
MVKVSQHRRKISPYHAVQLYPDRVGERMFRMHEFACACFLGNDGESEGRTTVSRSASAAASMN